jgi:hypothetical protein
MDRWLSKGVALNLHGFGAIFIQLPVSSVTIYTVGEREDCFVVQTDESVQFRRINT